MKSPLRLVGVAASLALGACGTIPPLYVPDPANPPQLSWKSAQWRCTGAMFGTAFGQIAESATVVGSRIWIPGPNDTAASAVNAARDECMAAQGWAINPARPTRYP